MRFNRHSLLASAAAALMLDDSTGTRSAADKKEPAAPDIADGGGQSSPQAPDPKTLPQGDFATDDGSGDGTSNQPDPSESDEKAALADFQRKAEAKGRREMHARIETVFASDEVVGREACAAELLAADLGTAKILATLAKMPKSDANGMLNNLRSAANPDLDAGAETVVDSKAASASIWDKAHKAAGIGAK